MGYLRRIIKWTCNAALVAILIVFTCLLWQVDNWERDLFTNYAGLTVVCDTTTDEAAEAARTTIKYLPGWELLDGPGIHAVRTTKLGFKDDIYVYVDTIGETTSVRIWSKSRTGMADFGQNPRNIMELLLELDKELGKIALGD